MFGPWDDLQSLKVTAQNHHVTPWCVGLSRDRETGRDEGDTQMRPKRTAWRVTWGAVVLESVSLHQICHHMTALQYKWIRLDSYALFLWLSEGDLHMSCDSRWLSPSQEDKKTEIVLLLIHSLHSKGVVSGWVCCEIKMHEQSAILFCFSDMQHSPKR